MTAKPSPRPWRCERRTSDDPAALPNEPEGESGTIYEYFIIDSHGNDIMSVYERADAALIVRAVNSFDDLVAGAKILIESWENDRDDASAADILRAALRKAGAL